MLEESTNVVFYEVKLYEELIIDYDEEDYIGSIKPQVQEETNVEESCKDKELEFQKDYLKELIIGLQLKGVLTGSKALFEVFSQRPHH